MTREGERHEIGGFYIRIISINEQTSGLENESIALENIGKGGFRFMLGTELQLEDRLHVTLFFPDGRSQDVFGRICYSDELDDGVTAYGFSVLKGFYSLARAVA